ncbi:uncharacterized protein LOC114755958 [Neltuma alba]|uniref:uncharacterized protein LOC114755958 n=1 Tax=Neltuma alba TaxID=207710 RepID=UPI0010A314DD|nr:uncharacterized protein LOC114755958 [Prosopis alba]
MVIYKLEKDADRWWRNTELILEARHTRITWEEVCFLSHEISRKGVLGDPSKVEAVLNWERPKIVTEIRSSLDLQGITEERVRLVQELKRKLTSTSVLIILNPMQTSVVYADTSKQGLGYVLTQQDEVPFKESYYGRRWLEQEGSTRSIANDLRAGAD